MKERIASRQIAHYARESLSNSIALTGDAVAAYKRGRYGSAFFLATIAMEEFAKCFMANDEIFNRQVNEHKMKQSIDWLRSARDHKLKHYKFAHESTYYLPVKFVHQVLDQKLDSAKQKALYVDIELNDQRKLLHISTPSKVSEARARRQISIIHDSLLNLIGNTLKGNYILEMGDELPPIDRLTLRNVKRMWTRRYKAEKSNVHEIEKQKWSRA
jgi:AbiV family abortive infection protein